MKLDPEKWDDLRKGLDYNEAPVQQSDQLNAPPVAPLGLGVWAEMLKITGLILLVIILIVLIVKLILKTKAPKKSDKKDQSISSPNEKIPTALSPLELLWDHFQKAKEVGDYRECLRILYQISLKKLGENGWVKTKVDKTNREYLDEIETGSIANDFAHLTLIHEYSWYGDTTVKASEFQAYEPQFINFINNEGLEKR
ncbi:DUF4129 domain-containing protein [Cryomorpha ignava]|uniref:DUF4129 domain-containing protein n=1 Tax=Cryomorpha ignava TaxID=101383 RepID=A0A7K3WP07_9FLAO|nr:DUF4129 domain-containing protein [Cryomorpha ignava]NEN23387.1 DUF4129 domain-containing protein [Cryomorpha ignava]